jgi:hypothetical protein
VAPIRLQTDFQQGLEILGNKRKTIKTQAKAYLCILFMLFGIEVRSRMDLYHIFRGLFRLITSMKLIIPLRDKIPFYHFLRPFPSTGSRSP